MEIPESVVNKGMFFALRYSNINNEEEAKNLVIELIERGMRTIHCFGGEVTWKEGQCQD